MQPAFGVHALLTQWQFEPVVAAAVAVAAALYLWGVIRVARRHPVRPWPWWRTALFLGGLAVIFLVIEGGVGAYDDSLYWDHMVQHLALLMVAPPLLIAGQPVTLLLHASRNPVHTWAKRVIRSRVVSFLTWPAFGLAAYCATIALTHLTGFTRIVLEDQFIHDAEHVLYLLVGYLFYLPILGSEPIRWRLAYPIRLLILVLAMPVDTFTGLVLGNASSGAGFSVPPRPPGSPSPVEDVHWAGAAMWVGGDAIMLLFMMIVVWMWSRDERADSLGLGWLELARRSRFEEMVAGRSTEPAVSPGDARQPAAANRGTAPASHGTIDDDEHLAAYNAYLAQLNGAAPESRRQDH